MDHSCVYQQEQSRSLQEPDTMQEQSRFLQQPDTIQKKRKPPKTEKFCTNIDCSFYGKNVHVHNRLLKCESCYMKSLVRPGRSCNTTNYSQIVTTNFSSSIPIRRVINDDSDSEDEAYVAAKETSKDSDDDEVEFVRSRTVEERNAEGFKNAIVIDE